MMVLDMTLHACVVSESQVWLRQNPAPALCILDKRMGTYRNAGLQ